jgi:hypothetical protein
MLKCVPSDRGICQDRRVRIIIECPERILHLEAEYIYADCPFVNFKPLAVRRRTIHLSVTAISRQSSAIGNPSAARLRGACCLSYPSSMVKRTSFISLISVITIA